MLQINQNQKSFARLDAGRNVCDRHLAQIAHRNAMPEAVTTLPVWHRLSGNRLEMSGYSTRYFGGGIDRCRVDVVGTCLPCDATEGLMIGDITNRGSRIGSTSLEQAERTKVKPKLKGDKQKSCHLSESSSALPATAWATLVISRSLM